MQDVQAKKQDLYTVYTNYVLLQPNYNTFSIIMMTMFKHSVCTI